MVTNPMAQVKESASDEDIAQAVAEIERQKALGTALVVWRLRKLSRTYPDNWRPWFNLGYYLRQQYGHWTSKLSPFSRSGNAAAISAYERCLDLCPETVRPAIWKELAGLYSRFRQDEVALSYASQAADENPDSMDDQINLAIAYFNSRKDVPRAKAILKEALRSRPAAEDIRYCLRRIALYEQGSNARIQT